MATEAVDTPVVEKAQEEVPEQEESSPKEPSASDDGSKPAEAPVEEGYDASLLVMVKGKAKRPARPDDAERNMQVQKLQEQIDKASARITEIKAILDARGSSRGVVNPEVQACRDKIQQLRAEFDTVLVGPHPFVPCPTAGCCRGWPCPGQAAGLCNSSGGRLFAQPQQWQLAGSSIGESAACQPTNRQPPQLEARDPPRCVAGCLPTAAAHRCRRSA